MATPIRNTEPGFATLVAAHNALKAQIGAGSSVHLDASEVVPSTATATDLPSSIAVLQSLIGTYNFHIADTLAHKASDAARVLLYTVQTCAAPVSSDGGLASAIAAVNDLHTKYTAHIASTAAHFNADSSNTDSSSAATNLSTLETRVNSLNTAMTAHLAAANAPTGAAPSLRLF